ncbi:MAG: hypothetical protein GFH27_549283n83 [Chloroflexi bacterium AL-W]|nr:hypothetical protein [Chloroflexi bacterium AL-N1]NOK64796.1 hypothetical protein [Chloroflexi bacterium AL-N10]NOK76566.1 hypothetical protein [Chloroflexi bacterium AL-N5]NOK80204.1 hypothetical protein [Chloroflexi bacterium AL-W]NOK86717.1 hypothetical protein [Chloroflexi bacterium AL-N15]
MAIIATRVIAILDMIDVMTMHYQRDSVAIEDIANSLSMSSNELTRYLDLLTRQGKIEWYEAGGQSKIKLSLDGYLVLSMQNARRRHRLVTHS